MKTGAPIIAVTIPAFSSNGRTATRETTSPSTSKSAPIIGDAIDPGPIRDILRDHIVKHSAVEPGTTVLGVEITERKFHTLYSLSVELGIERLRLARLLKKLSIIPEGATEVQAGNMVFEIATTIPLIEAFKTAVPLSDVPSYLGATKGQVEALYRVGILQPSVPRTGRGSVRNVTFTRKHLDDILLRLDDFPECGKPSGGETQPIAFACQRGAGPLRIRFCLGFSWTDCRFSQSPRSLGSLRWKSV